MICINNTYTDPYFNAAAEEYLFRKFSGSLFMIWQNEPSVVIGRNQNIYDETDIDFNSERLIKTVRRFSGGGAVYHDPGNVNLTFMRSDGNTNFSYYAGVISQFLSEAGIKTSTDRRNSIYIDNRKISGSAQYVRGSKILFHATLLFSTDLKSLEQALKLNTPEAPSDKEMLSSHFVRSVKGPVTNIINYLSEPMSVDSFKKIAFSYFFNLEKNGTIYSFTPEDIENINELMQSKYSTQEWTMRGLIHNKNFERSFC